jgi:hypothetical protein
MELRSSMCWHDCPTVEMKEVGPVRGTDVDIYFARVWRGLCYFSNR